MKKYYSNPVSMISLGRDIKWKNDQIIKIRNNASNCIFTSDKDKCPICRSTHISFYVSIYGFDYYICNKCNHLFYIQNISDESIKSIYDKDSSYLDFYVDSKLYKSRINNISIPRVQFISKHLFNNNKDIIQSKEWLDIGCGGGQILVTAKQFGYKVRGIEPGDQGRYITETYGIPVKQLYVDPENIKYEICDANIISLFDVLEHLQNPYKLLLSIVENMDINSYIVASVPRHPSFSLFSILCFPQYTSRYLVVPDHIHIFSDNSLTILFKLCGLEISHCWYFGQDFYEMISTMLKASNHKLNDFSDVYINSINQIQSKIDKNHLSDSVLVIAKKL